VDFGIVLSLTVRNVEQFCEHSCDNDIHINCHPHGVGQGVENALYRNLSIDGWNRGRMAIRVVIKGKGFNSSIILN